MEAKLAPKMPQWMVDHANKYMSSGGKDGHIYKIKPPGYGDLEVPALLLTTTGRKSGEKFIFPLFYGETGNGRPALRWDVNPALIGVALAETAETAETPAA